MFAIGKTKNVPGNNNIRTLFYAPKSFQLIIFGGGVR